MTPAEELLAVHLDWLRQRGLASRTVQARHRALYRMEVLLERPLLEASEADLRVWRAHLQLAPNTVLSYVSHARQFYGWAAAQGRIAGNPAAALPVPKHPRMLPRPVGEGELLAAVAAARPRVRPWLILAGWAGLRAVEIALLRRENWLDSGPARLIRVAADATKGGHERLVPMSAFVAAELAPHLPGRGWVFPRGDGRPGPNQPARVSYLANAHLRDCGTAATLHQLRHRFATQLYQATHDLRAVQELLGHQDPAATAGYAAYDAAAAAAAVEAIPVPGPLRAIS